MIILRMDKLHHGMLLDAKSVMDNALPELAEIKELIPEVLHDKFKNIIDRFEDTLCEADVSDNYQERTKTNA